ncbi:GPX2, partial [Cordylochernes scorpioides]
MMEKPGGSLSRSSSTEERKVNNFFELSGRKLNGDTVRFERFRGKVVLVENIASLADFTRRELNQMNDLARIFKNDLVILGYPCNQFGYQENTEAGELLNMFKHVRPGKGFKPQFTIMYKVEVNGYRTNSVYRYLKSRLPIPRGEDEDSRMVLGDPKILTWMPVCRNDLSGNFEKFLIDREGQPYARYGPQIPTIALKDDIDRLLTSEALSEVPSADDACPYYIVSQEMSTRK